MHILSHSHIGVSSRFIQLEIDLLEEQLFVEKESIQIESTGLSFLIAEDDPDMRTYIGSTLLAGFLNSQVIYASNGIQALNQARKEQPDLIISEQDLSRLDGITLAGMLKTHPKSRGIPVLLISNKTVSISAELEANSQKISGILYKPFNAEMLVQQIRNILSQYSSNDQV